MLCKLLLYGASAATAVAFGLARPDARRLVMRPPRWILVYAGGPQQRTGHPRYTVGDFVRLVAAVDTAGRPRTWLTTGAIFLELYAPSGRVFTDWIGGPPASGEDWRAYVDTLLAPSGPIARLDSAVAIVTRTLGPLGAPYRVAIMIPYSTYRLDTLRYGGVRYSLRDAVSGGTLAGAYVRDVAARFRERRFRYLDLEGFYWLREVIEGIDTAVVPAVAERVHQAGFRLFWIPYFDAPGWRDWRRFSVDAAWLQPNYFFNLNVAAVRVDSALARARAAGLGVELEFDGRLLSSADFEDRLDTYLSRLAAASDLRSGPLSVYEGGGALIALSETRDPWHRALYERLVAVLSLPDSLLAR
jgi:hypothetical protein